MPKLTIGILGLGDIGQNIAKASKERQLKVIAPSGFPKLNSFEG
jgi:phosphoglycerate dehydrogenase-like enzyme